MKEAEKEVRRIGSLDLGTPNPADLHAAGFDLRRFGHTRWDLITALLTHRARYIRSWRSYHSDRKVLNQHLLQLAGHFTTSEAAKAVLRRAAIDSVVEALNDPHLAEVQQEVESLICVAAERAWGLQIVIYEEIEEIEGAMVHSMGELLHTSVVARVYSPGFGRYALIQAPRSSRLAAAKRREAEAVKARADAKAARVKSLSDAKATATATVDIRIKQSDPKEYARLQLARKEEKFGC